MFRTGLALCAGRTIKTLLTLRGTSRGETAPGLVALKCSPTFVSDRQKYCKRRIIISGTNGKTTTTELVRSIFSAAKISYITNPSGSNLLRGIASALLQDLKQIETAVWEVDEAALVEVAKQTRPTHILLTNIFRDQLDRYGDVDSIRQRWQKLLHSLPKTILLLNADDPILAYLGLKLTKHTVIYFGLDYKNGNTIPDKHADSIFCPACQKALHYHFVSYSHLGNYVCGCGFKRPKLDFSATSIKQSVDSISFYNNKHTVIAPLQGIYNIYNVLASLALASSFNINLKRTIKTIAEFKPAFGRQEILHIKSKDILIFLIKNPTGANQVLETLTTNKHKLTLCIAINDRIADGTDVSWLWDVAFEKLQTIAESIIVTGDRALDMGVRLKYTDITQDFISIEPDIHKAMKLFLQSKKKQLYLLPTYTAMWELRESLQKL